MKVLEFDSKYNNYSFEEKKDYIKKLINKEKLEIEIVSLITNNKDIIENFDLLDSISKTKVFKEKNKLSRLELYSLIIQNYISQNKTKELTKLFNNLDSKKIKSIINYEIKTKT